MTPIDSILLMAAKGILWAFTVYCVCLVWAVLP